jgi:hypothetical protein
MVYKAEFEFNSGVQQFRAPFTGNYFFEAWGAQGGDVYSTYWKETFKGGYGGYSCGTKFLNKGEMVFVVVGQQGMHSVTSYTYNGGGRSNPSTSCSTQTASGGGCTHFALVSGVLKDLTNHRHFVLIVASGGGGAYTRMCNEVSDSGSMSGGNGGGIVGTSPEYFKRGRYTLTVPTGGNQSRGGISSTSWYENTIDSTTKAYNGDFGVGGIYHTDYGFGGGGSGWYGGASGQWRAGAGGSGYLSIYLSNHGKYMKHMACFNCSTSTSESDYTISVDVNSTEAISDVAKSGNGFARITLINTAITCRVVVRDYTFLFIAQIILFY